MHFSIFNRKPIIIGGFYRSGTSLVRRLLDSHSKIYCGPEVKFWRDLYGDYKDDPYAHIRFFSTAKHMGLPSERITEIFGETYIKLINETMHAKGKIRWADKNPENLIYLNEWNQLLNGRMDFLFVVRHPLDALASLKEVRFDKTMPSSFDGKIQECARYLSEGLNFLEKHPKKTTILRYESLVTAPEKTLKEAMKSLNLNYEKTMLSEYWKPERGTGIEDPKVTATTIVHKESLMRWKTDLTIQEISIATKTLQPLLTKLGYQ